MTYALIKSGIVENTIIADEAFIDHISSQYDHVIRIDELEIKPSIGWGYVDEIFVDPTPPLDPPVEDPPPSEA
jgi:hypothetical protein